MGICVDFVYVEAWLGVCLLILLGLVLRAEYTYIGMSTGISASNTAFEAAVLCFLLAVGVFFLRRRTPRQRQDLAHEQVGLLREVEMEFVNT